MSVRVQVILDEKEAAKFRSQAARESKSLSAWLRDAGRRMLEASEHRPLNDPESLKAFFEKCRDREKGTEPDWIEHKAAILKGFQAGGKL
jgi:plasmid stability protein